MKITRLTQNHMDTGQQTRTFKQMNSCHISLKINVTEKLLPKTFLKCRCLKQHLTSNDTCIYMKISSHGKESLDAVNWYLKWGSNHPSFSHSILDVNAVRIGAGCTPQRPNINLPAPVLPLTIFFESNSVFDIPAARAEVITDRLYSSKEHLTSKNFCMTMQLCSCGQERFDAVNCYLKRGSDHPSFSLSILDDSAVRIGAKDIRRRPNINLPAQVLSRTSFLEFNCVFNVPAVRTEVINDRLNYSEEHLTSNGICRDMQFSSYRQERWDAVNWYLKRRSDHPSFSHSILDVSAVRSGAEDLPRRPNINLPAQVLPLTSFFEYNCVFSVPAVRAEVITERLNYSKEHLTSNGICRDMQFSSYRQERWDAVNWYLKRRPDLPSFSHSILDVGAVRIGTEDIPRRPNNNIPAPVLPLARFLEFNSVFNVPAARAEVITDRLNYSKEHLTTNNICIYMHIIRYGQERWDAVNWYLKRRSDLPSFSHSILDDSEVRIGAEDIPRRPNINLSAQVLSLTSFFEYNCVYNGPAARAEVITDRLNYHKEYFTSMGICTDMQFSSYGNENLDAVNCYLKWGYDHPSFCHSNLDVSAVRIGTEDIPRRSKINLPAPIFPSTRFLEFNSVFNISAVRTEAITDRLSYSKEHLTSNGICRGMQFSSYQQERWDAVNCYLKRSSDHPLFSHSISDDNAVRSGAEDIPPSPNINLPAPVFPLTSFFEFNSVFYVPAARAEVITDRVNYSKEYLTSKGICTHMQFNSYGKEIFDAVNWYLKWGTDHPLFSHSILHVNAVRFGAEGIPPRPYIELPAPALPLTRFLESFGFNVPAAGAEFINEGPNCTAIAAQEVMDTENRSFSSREWVEEFPSITSVDEENGYGLECSYTLSLRPSNNQRDAKSLETTTSKENVDNNNSGSDERILRVYSLPVEESAELDTPFQQIAEAGSILTDSLDNNSLNYTAVREGANIMASVYNNDGVAAASTHSHGTTEIHQIYLLTAAAESVLDMGYQLRVVLLAIKRVLMNTVSEEMTGEIILETVLEIEEENEKTYSVLPSSKLDQGNDIMQTNFLNDCPTNSTAIRDNEPVYGAVGGEAAFTPGIGEIQNYLQSDAVQNVLDMGFQPTIVLMAIDRVLMNRECEELTEEMILRAAIEIEDEVNESTGEGACGGEHPFDNKEMRD